MSIVQPESEQPLNFLYTDGLGEMCFEIHAASCQSDEECNLSDVCLNGQCLDPCNVRAACGINAECDVRSHIKQCSCPPGFTGNSEVECVRCK